MSRPRPLDPGLWVILATPFDAAGDVDEASLARQVEHALAAGADGLVALGVFGEAAVLSLAEQARVAGVVAGVAARHGSRLVLGVSGRSTAVALEQGLVALGAAQQAGLERDSLALMVQVATTSEDALVDHLTAVHERTGVGIVVQDYPATTGVAVGTDTLVGVVRRCDFVVAVKAEAPPTPPAISALAGACDVPVFGGLGGVGLLDELVAGASGAMTGFSAPEGLRAALDGFAAGGFEAARAAWAPWLPLATFEAQPGIALALRKQLMHRRGVIDHAAVRPPARALPPALHPLVELHLAHLPSTLSDTRPDTVPHAGGH